MLDLGVYLESVPLLIKHLVLSQSFAASVVAVSVPFGPEG